MPTASGTYKTLRPTIAFVWDVSWEKTYAQEYKNALEKRGSPVPTRMPIVVNLKEGQEVTVLIGDRRSMVTDIERIVPDEGMNQDEKDSPRQICAVDVMITVGSKSHAGIVLAYDDKPVCIIDANDIRPVKKRQK